MLPAGYAHSTDVEFFDMLRAYKADNVDQRAPAPPGMHNVLRGEAEASSNSIHSSPVKLATVQPILPHHATPYTPQRPAPQTQPPPPHHAALMQPGQFYQQQPMHSAAPTTPYQQSSKPLSAHQQVRVSLLVDLQGVDQMSYSLVG